jgi:hypothetical protein
LVFFSRSQYLKINLVDLIILESEEIYMMRNEKLVNSAIISDLEGSQ